MFRTLLLPMVIAVTASTKAYAQDTVIYRPDEVGNSLEAGAVLQFRYIGSFRRELASPDDEEAIGFNFRRLRLRLGGTTADGKAGFFFQTEHADGRSELLDAYGTLELAEGVRFRFGQFRLPFQREITVSAAKQLTADRASLTNNLNPTSGIRTQGLELRLSNDTTRASFVFSDGTASINESFNSEDDGIAGTVRLELTPIGTLGPFSQITAPRGTPRGLLLGLAGHGEQREAGGDRWAFAADVTYQHDGFNIGVIGAGHVAEDLNLGPDPQAESAYGIIAQGGLYLTERFEPFARYQWGTSSDDDEADLHVVTAGFNYYFVGQALRFVADAGYAFDDIGPTFERESEGLLPTASGDEGTFTFRTQLQMLF